MVIGKQAINLGKKMDSSLISYTQTLIDQQIKKWTKTKTWVTSVIFMSWNGHDEAWQENQKPWKKTDKSELHKN